MNRLIAILVLLTLPFAGSGQRAMIFLSLEDCINCTANLDKILRIAPGTGIVLPEKYKADASDIEIKYGLPMEKMIWSDSLYSAAHTGGMRSTIVIFDSSGQQSYLLKDFDPRYLNKLADATKDNSNVSGLRPTGKHTGVITHNIENIIPSRMSFSIWNDFLFVTNHISDVISVYNTVSKKVSPLHITEAIEKSIYQEKFKDKAGEIFGLYKKEAAMLPMLKPKYTNYRVINDSTMLLLGYVYRLADMDTTYAAEKSFFIMPYNFQTSTYYKALDVDFRNAEYALTGLYFFNNGIDFYFGVHKASTTTPLHFLAHTVKKDKQLVGSNIVPIGLPAEYREKEVFYNFDNAVVSYPYVILPISNKVYNMETQTELTIPITDSCFVNNDPMGAVNTRAGLSFYIYDLIFDKSAKNLGIIYSRCGDYYVMKCSAKNGTIVSNTPLSNQDILGAPRFSNKPDGRVYFITKEKHLAWEQF